MSKGTQLTLSLIVLRTVKSVPFSSFATSPTNRENIFWQKNNTMAKTVDLTWIDRMAVDAYVETMFVIEKQVRKNRLKYLQQRLHPYQKTMKE